MVQKSESRRGRPRAYDPEAALAQAMATFWDAGYAATSLDDLAAATGMNRPSLYGAFGDKRALYRQAIASYRANARQKLAAALADDVPLPEARGDLAGGLREIDKAFEARIRHARDTGELAADVDPIALGRIASAVLYF